MTPEDRKEAWLVFHHAQRELLDLIGDIENYFVPIEGEEADAERHIEYLESAVQNVREIAHAFYRPDQEGV